MQLVVLSIAKFLYTYLKWVFTCFDLWPHRDRSGVIQAFEFTYEVAWKTFKKAAEYEGKEASSPRDSLKQAYILNIIENDEEQEWINMLKHRNITSHTYKEDLALMILDVVESKYRHLFASSLKRLKDRYE